MGVQEEGAVVTLLGYTAEDHVIAINRSNNALPLRQVIAENVEEGREEFRTL